MEMKRHQSDQPSPHVFTRCRACISFIHSTVGVLDNHVVSRLNICLYRYLSRIKCPRTPGHGPWMLACWHRAYGRTDYKRGGALLLLMSQPQLLDGLLAPLFCTLLQVTARGEGENRGLASYSTTP